MGRELFRSWRAQHTYLNENLSRITGELFADVREGCFSDRFE